MGKMMDYESYIWTQTSMLGLKQVGHLKKTMRSGPQNKYLVLIWQIFEVIDT